MVYPTPHMAKPRKTMADDELASWHERWQSDRLGFHLSETNPALERWFPRLGASAGQRIFVPLCGKSVDLLWLAERDLQVFGCELSKMAVDAFFAEAGLQAQAREGGEGLRSGAIEIAVGDFFRLDLRSQGSFELAYDRAAYVAIDPELRSTYTQRLVDALLPGGRLLLITLEYDAALMSGPPFSVAREDVRARFPGIELLEREEQIDTAPAKAREVGMSSFAELTWLWRNPI